jgi:hypothetical protein
VLKDAELRPVPGEYRHARGDALVGDREELIVFHRPTIASSAFAVQRVDVGSHGRVHLGRLVRSTGAKARMVPALYQCRSRPAMFAPRSFP